ncbi:T9SS type A sorting domain-containing protein [Bacteroidota bacterium]
MGNAFPPASIVTFATSGSPNIYFTTDCSVNISSAYKENGTINIYPNPNSGIFNIAIDKQQTENIKLKIYNSIEQQVFQEDLKQIQGTYARQINLEKFPAGIYFLYIISPERTINKKIILE